MEYRIYSPSTVLCLLYQARLRHSRITCVISYKIDFGKGRSCIILYEPNAYRCVQHFSFYALSSGWNKMTETGYKSLFVQFRNERGGRIPSYQEMVKHWKSYCHDLGLTLDNEEHQMGLL